MNNLLIYLHLQKTGGQTMRHLLMKLYGEENCFNFGVPRKVAHRYQDLMEKTEAERQQIKCVMGQLAFGIHNAFPQSADYIAFVRHPIERTISHYYYILRNVNHREHIRLKESNMSLEEFLEAFPYTAYYQTRIFLPVVSVAETQEEIRKPLPENGLEAAKANIISSIPIVGLTERYDESLLLWQARFNWKDVQYKSRNIGTNKPKRESLSPTLLSKIEQHVSVDMELYEFVKARFEQNVADAGLDFQKRYQTFQLKKLEKPKPLMRLRSFLKRKLKAMRGN